jgi:hypothetical protein
VVLVGTPSNCGVAPAQVAFKVRIRAKVERHEDAHGCQRENDHDVGGGELGAGQIRRVTFIAVQSTRQMQLFAAPNNPPRL